MGEYKYTHTNSGISVSNCANGSHKSGTDIISDIGSLSNKTSKYDKDTFAISSYRLTSVCNEKDVGTIEK